MTKRNRQFVGIYFSDGLADHRKKRDVNVAFSRGDPLFEICKKLGSTGIKDAIGVQSYAELVQQADREDRSLSNYIKHKLKASLDDEQTNPTC